MTALQASPNRVTSGRFGIRNAMRPFASQIFAAVPGNETLFQCAPTRFDQLPTGSAQRPFLYFMLHGLDTDTSRFWGDDPARGTVEAINTSTLPRKGLKRCPGRLLLGRVDRRSARQGRQRNSVAEITRKLHGTVDIDGRGDRLRGLHRRALLPGRGWRILRWYPCTSPSGNRSPAAGPAAEALFEARRLYLAQMPHGRPHPP